MLSSRTCGPHDNIGKSYMEPEDNTVIHQTLKCLHILEFPLLSMMPMRIEHCYQKVMFSAQLLGIIDQAQSTVWDCNDCELNKLSRDKARHGKS